MLGFREDFDFKNRWQLKDYITVNGTTYFVSTVDLGIDHSHITGKPEYYETMVFDKRSDVAFEIDVYMDRYSTKEEAEKGHYEVVYKLKKGELELY